MEKELLSITKKSGYVLIGNIIFVLLNFLFDFISARFLGASIYGKFVYIYSFIIFISYFLLLGLNNGLVYFIPKYNHKNEKQKINNIINIYSMLIFILSVLASFILVIKSSWIAKNILKNVELSFVLKISSPLIILIVMVLFYQSILRGFEEIYLYVFSSNFFEPFIRVILLILFLILGFKILGLILSYIFSFFFCLIFVIYKLLKTTKLFLSVKDFHKKETLELFTYSIPLLFSGLLFIIMTKVDVLMIGYFLTEKWVGIYNIAIRVGTFSSIVFVVIRIVFSPVISRLYHVKKLKELENLNKTITKWIFGSNLIFFLLILIFNNEIMKIFGSEFLLGNIALIIVTGAQTLKSSAGASGFLIMMTGYPFFDFFINFITVIINISLNLFLIPKIGITGAAIALLASFLVNSILKLLFVYKVHKIHPYNKEYFRIVYISLIPFVLIFYLKKLIHIHWLAFAIIFTILFLIIFSVIYSFCGLSKDDKIIVDAIKKKLLILK